MAKKLTGEAKGRLLEKFGRMEPSTNGRVHVVPSQDGWLVKKAGAKRVSSIENTKADAIKAANGLKSVERVIIHKKDGTIQRNTTVRK